MFKKIILFFMLFVLMTTGSFTKMALAKTTSIGVTYQAHVQNIGWQNWTSNGGTAGTTGQSLNMEAINISLINAIPGMGIRYQAHVQNIGWQNWVSDGAMAGTTGQSLRIEALRIIITCDDKGWSGGIGEFIYSQTLTYYANSFFNNNGYSSSSYYPVTRNNILDSVAGVSCFYIDCHGGNDNGNLSISGDLMSITRDEMNSYTRGFYKFVYLDCCHGGDNSSFASAFNIYDGDGQNHAFLSYYGYSYDSYSFRNFAELVFDRLAAGYSYGVSVQTAGWDCGVVNYQLYGNIDSTF